LFFKLFFSKEFSNSVRNKLVVSFKMSTDTDHSVVGIKSLSQLLNVNGAHLLKRDLDEMPAKDNEVQASTPQGSDKSTQPVEKPSSEISEVAAENSEEPQSPEKVDQDDDKKVSDGVSPVAESSENKELDGDQEMTNDNDEPRQTEEEVEQDQRSEADPAHETAEPNTPGAVVVKPTLRGTFNETLGSWIGEWAMSDSDFDNGITGKFEYKKGKGIPEVDPEKPETISGQPKDLYMEGFFLLREGDKFRKVPEKDILIRFSATPEGTIAVEGTGKNKFGVFSLSGLFDPETSSLNLDRFYEKFVVAQASTSKNKKKSLGTTLGSTPRQKQPQERTWGDAFTPSDISGPAAAVNQRVRRAPSHLSEAPDADSNRRNMAQLLPIVDKLLSADRRKYFHAPVDPVILGIPNYFDVINEPMDLGTVRQGIVAGTYDAEDQVFDHIRLTFHNAMTFNPAKNDVHATAKSLLATFQTELSKLMARRLTEKPKKRKSAAFSSGDSKRSKSYSKVYKDDSHRYGESGDDDDDGSRSGGRRSKRADAIMVQPDNEELRLLRKQMEMMSHQLESLKAVTIQSQQMQLAVASPRPGAHLTSDLACDLDYHSVQAPVAAPKRNRAPPKPKAPKSYSSAYSSSYVSNDIDDEVGGRTQKTERPLSYQEKRALGQDINKLPGDKVQKVIDIITESGNQMGGDGAEEVEIDIEKLDTPTLKALQRYVREVLRTEKKKAIKDGVM